MVLLDTAGVPIHSGVAEYHDHDHVPAVQLHDVRRVPLHGVLLPVPKHHGRLRAPRLALGVEDPQLVRDVAVVSLDSASVHKDVFLEVRKHVLINKTAGPIHFTGRLNFNIKFRESQHAPGMILISKESNGNTRVMKKDAFIYKKAGRGIHAFKKLL